MAWAVLREEPHMGTPDAWVQAEAAVRVTECDVYSSRIW